MLPEEHHDTADEEDHGQKEATEKAKPIHAHINRATSTSTSTPVPLLIQTRPKRDLDTDFDVSLDLNQPRIFNTPHTRYIEDLHNEVHTTRPREEPTSPTVPWKRTSTLADGDSLKTELKDRFFGIEALLGEIETRRDATQELVHAGYIQEIAKLTQKTFDINTEHRNDIDHREFEALRTRLTNIKRRENKNSNAIHTWNAKKMTTLVNKDSTASLTELKTGLVRQIRSIKTLLDDKTVLYDGTQTHKCKRYIRKINELTMEAGAKLVQIKGDIKTNELNNFKISLTNIKYKKAKIFADIRAQDRDEMVSVINRARALQNTLAPIKSEPPKPRGTTEPALQRSATSGSQQLTSTPPMKISHDRGPTSLQRTTPKRTTPQREKLPVTQNLMPLTSVTMEPNTGTTSKTKISSALGPPQSQSWPRRTRSRNRMRTSRDLIAGYGARHSPIPRPPPEPPPTTGEHDLDTKTLMRGRPQPRTPTTSADQLQINQQKVQDEPRSRHITQGKPSTPKTMDTAFSCTRSATGLPETAPTRPPPEPPPCLLQNSSCRRET